MPSGDGDTGSDPASIPAKIETIVESLPPERRQQVMEMIETISHHSGPICTPDDLAKYEAILPGLAERIVRLPEREQEHRHAVVAEVIKRDFDLRARGQALAIVSLVLLLAFSALLAALGHPDWAGRVAIGTIVAVVGIFVTGKWLDRRLPDQDGGAPPDPPA